MPRPFAHAALLLAVLAAAAPALAVQDKGQGDIVVTGRREPPRKAMQRFVRQVAVPVDGQLARFSDPVCPTVVGLQPPHGSTVVARILRTAAAAGVPAGRPGCRLNLILIFAADGDALVKEMRAKGLFLDDVDTTHEDPFRSGPVHAWNLTQIRNEDGRAGSRPHGPFEASVLNVRTASILNPPTQQAITGSVIVVQTGAAEGKSLAQLADYAAMRALGGARPPAGEKPADTILTLFDPGAAPPATMTELDRSYLRALYATRPNASAATQTQHMSREMVRDLAGEPRKREP